MSKKKKKKLKINKKKLKKSAKKKNKQKGSRKSDSLTKLKIKNVEKRDVSSAEFLRINDAEEDILSLGLKKKKGKQKDGKKTKPKKEKKVSNQEKRAVHSTLMKDPVFRELAEPKLPELRHENRARLQIQSPTRLYFYWSVKNNPFKTLNRVFGNSGNYTLVVKFVNKTKNLVEFFPIEVDGNWWFDAEADSSYQAEVGFYAPGRPFIRIIYSNEVQTPRRSPSKRKDLMPRFDVSANQFAEVLDVSGYKRDAVEVALAGDDLESANKATQKTYFELFGKDTERSPLGKDDELRFVLLALASGYSLKDLEPEISSTLFAFLEIEGQNLNAERVLSALKQNFDLFDDEYLEEQEIGPATFGASLVNFQKTFIKRKKPNSLLPKLFNPDSISSIDCLKP